jgi:predicted dehydrogenase
MFLFATPVIKGFRMNNISRRTFIKGSTIAAAGICSSAMLQPHARAMGANSDIRMGVVGIGSNVKIGGKGKQDLRKFRKYPGVRITALCDVDRKILDAQVADCKRHKEPVEAYTDVRKMLASKNVDAIIVTTPNHWHALVTIWACQAGKHVYVQKPASHNIFEGRKMVEAARKYNRVVQCTNNSRSATGFKEALEYVQKGNLGKMLCVYGLNYKPRGSIGLAGGVQQIPKSIDYDLWSGPAPQAPLIRKHLHYDWHWDWRYGNGDLGNMGIHFMDGCRMAVGESKLPKHVMSIGGRFSYKDDGQTPNTLLTYFDYKPVPVIFEVRGLPKNKSIAARAWGRNMDTFHGVGQGVVVLCEGGHLAKNKVFDKAGKLIKQFKPTTPEVGANFLQAVRNGKPGELVADIEEGHTSAALVHLANISHRLGKTAPDGEITDRIAGQKELAKSYKRFKTHLDANGVDLKTTAATLGPMLTVDPRAERFIGDFSDEANKLVTRQYRKPFVVPDKV